MLNNIKVAPHMLKSKDKEAIMPQKLVVTALIVVCITVLVFTWMTRKTLCEIRIRSGQTEVAAMMAYESVR